jgi:hypothetical protein
MAKSYPQEMYVDWLGKIYHAKHTVHMSTTAHLRELQPYEEGYTGIDRKYIVTCSCPSIIITIDNEITLESEHVRARSERIDDRTTCYVFKAENYPFQDVVW